MLTAKQQKLKEELKKKHKNKLNKSKQTTKNNPPTDKNSKVDICEADCICEEIKEKNSIEVKTELKTPFTFSKNPITNIMLLGDVLGTPAFKKKYKR